MSLHYLSFYSVLSRYHYVLVPWATAVGLQDGSQGCIDVLKGVHASIHVPQKILGLMVSVTKEILGFIEVMRDLLFRDLTEHYCILAQ